MDHYPSRTRLSNIEICVQELLLAFGHTAHSLSLSLSRWNTQQAQDLTNKKKPSEIGIQGFQHSVAKEVFLFGSKK